jgi:hypothetical protein
MARSLRQQPCLSACDWMPTGELIAGDLVFACAGCTTEWVRTAGWAPRNLDGSIAQDVSAERARAPG